MMESDLKNSGQGLCYARSSSILALTDSAGRPLEMFVALEL